MPDNYTNMNMIPKTLYDITLAVIGRNLHTVANISSSLSFEDKSRLLHWMVDHDRIYLKETDTIASVTYHLVSSQYKELRFSDSTLVDDRLLFCFGGVGCRLTTLSLVKLTNITGL